MTHPCISMTWPQYRRHECSRFGRLVRLAPKEAELLLLYLLRRGEIVSTDEAVAFLWPDPDHSPLYERTTFYQHRSALAAKLPGMISVAAGFGGIVERPAREDLAA